MTEDHQMSDEEKSTIAGLTAQVTAMNGTLGQIQKSIDGGNGSGPGMKILVDRHEQILVEMKDRNRWLERLVWGVVITTLLQLGMGLLRSGAVQVPVGRAASTSAPAGRPSD